MKFSKEQSSQFATVTFVATILVVMCHCDDLMPNKDGLVRFLGGIFSDANVANFFFLSGFFVARHYGEKGWYLRAISKRFRTLVIPYFGWCMIYLCGQALLNHFGISRPSKILDVREVFGIGFLTHPIDFALWYIKTLFYFILVAPLFFRFQSRYRFVFLVCAILLLCFSLSSLGRSPLFGMCFNLVGFICFLMGAEMAFCKPMRDVFLRPGKLRNVRWGGMVWLVYWIFGAIVVNSASGLVYDVLHPLYVLFAVFCLQRLVASVRYRAGDVFVRASFVIYASHLSILWCVLPCLTKLLGDVPILCFASLVCVLVLGGVVMTEFLRKFSRPVLAVLTGGRG